MSQCVWNDYLSITSCIISIICSLCILDYITRYIINSIQYIWKKIICQNIIKKINYKNLFEELSIISIENIIIERDEIKNKYKILEQEYIKQLGKKNL